MELCEVVINRTSPAAILFIRASCSFRIGRGVEGSPAGVSMCSDGVVESRLNAFRTFVSFLP